MIKNSPANADHSDITVASYYFGQYHPNDPRNLEVRGREWSEWELIKDARPRFPGHHQPKVPLWGYEDESDPKVMAKKIDAAADHGIDAFIFDWYHYDDGPFLERPIDNGFLKAENNHRMKFALMWANHDWQKNLFPFKKGDHWDTIYPGKVSPANFETICDHIIKTYFSHPSYWKIDEKPYFSFFELSKLLSNFGSVEATRAALDAFRQKARNAGLPGIHLNIVAGAERTILPGDDKSLDTNKLILKLGFDSATSYAWVNHVPLPEQETDYNQVRDSYFDYWKKIASELPMPYFPNVLMGWDASPRCDQSTTLDNSGYPYMNVIVNNTPEHFETTLRMTKERLLADPKGPRVLIINCWNEWTEGSYLEPDTVNGYGYLEAVKRVVVNHSKKLKKKANLKTQYELTDIERVIGCIRGKAIGGTLGAPPEGRMELLNLTFYDPVPTGILPNDDFDIQLLFLESVEGAGGRVDALLLAKTWSERMTFPFDEYGVATLNLKRGLYPPVTGWFDNPFKNCMGSPIRSELWALLAPARPRLAAYFAMQDSMIDHAEESMAGEMFFSALESLAFSGETDFIKLIETAYEVIDPRTQTAQAVKFAVDNYAQMDWKVLRTEVLERFGNPNFTEAPQNIAFTLFGLLYYPDDFEKALLCSTNCGYDTDCTAATLGAIWGLVNGDRFPERWTQPIGSMMLASHGVYDMAIPGRLHELATHIVRVRTLVAERYNSVSEADATTLVAEQLADLTRFRPAADSRLTLAGSPLLEHSVTLTASENLRTAAVRHPFNASVAGTMVTVAKPSAGFVPATARVAIEEMSGRLHTITFVTPHELWTSESEDVNELLELMSGGDVKNFKPTTLGVRTFHIQDMTQRGWLLLRGYVHFHVADKYRLGVFSECPARAWLDGKLIQDSPDSEPCIPAPHRAPAHRVADLELTAGWKRWDILLQASRPIREGKVCPVIAQAYTKQLMDYRFRRSTSGVYAY